jgi:hypothetical protein
MSERWIQARKDRESHPEKFNKEAFVKLARKWLGRDWDIPENQTGYSNWDTPKYQPRDVPGKDLFELVCARGGCSLSDPRDMIYAHLGLVSAETRNMVPIDYELTVAQLYTSMTELYAQLVGIQNIIIFAGVEPERRDPSLPSWVIDWSLSKPWWADNYDHAQGSRRDQSLPSWFVDWSLSKPWWADSYNSSYADAQRSLRFHSLAVPHVLAVCGGSCGPIDSIIPASSWPTILNCSNSSISTDPWEMEPDHSMLQDILDWISKSDDNVLRARRPLLDFTVSMANANYLGDYQDWGRQRFSDSVLWQKVIIAISQWPELSTTSGPLYREDNPDSRGSFIRLCLRNLVFLAAAYSGNECVAVLKSQRVVARVSTVAQPGDFVANIRMGGREDYIVFRPCGLELNHEEEELIRNDFDVRYPPGTNDLPKIDGYYWNSFQVPFQNCRYVAHTTKPSYTEPPWSSSEHTIFALH